MITRCAGAVWISHRRLQMVGLDLPHFLGSKEVDHDCSSPCISAPASTRGRRVRLGPVRMISSWPTIIVPPPLRPPRPSIGAAVWSLGAVGDTVTDQIAWPPCATAIPHPVNEPTRAPSGRLGSRTTLLLRRRRKLSRHRHPLLTKTIYEGKDSYITEDKDKVRQHEPDLIVSSLERVRIE